MDELTDRIQHQVPLCSLFVDVIVLADEQRYGVNVKPKKCLKDTTKYKFFETSQTTTKYMNYDFGGYVQTDGTPERIEAQEI